jgi:uncharacterized protein YdhG (YjbR/CyaY superfamily)
LSQSRVIRICGRRFALEKNEQVDAYLAKLAPDRREALERLRAMVFETVPNVQETMQYGMPTYEQNGSVVCAFASQKNYISAYMDTAMVEKHKSDLGADCGKSCVRFKRLNDQLAGTLRTILRETVQSRA